MFEGRGASDLGHFICGSCERATSSTWPILLHMYYIVQCRKSKAVSGQPAPAEPSPGTRAIGSKTLPTHRAQLSEIRRGRRQASPPRWVEPNPGRNLTTQLNLRTSRHEAPTKAMAERGDASTAPRRSSAPHAGKVSCWSMPAFQNHLHVTTFHTHLQSTRIGTSLAAAAAHCSRASAGLHAYCAFTFPLVMHRKFYHDVSFRCICWEHLQLRAQLHHERRGLPDSALTSRKKAGETCAHSTMALGRWADPLRALQTLPKPQPSE